MLVFSEVSQASRRQEGKKQLQDEDGHLAGPHSRPGDSSVQFQETKPGCNKLLPTQEGGWRGLFTRRQREI